MSKSLWVVSVAGAWIAGVASAAVHDGDWLIRVVDQRLEAGAVVDGAPAFPVRVLGAAFGADGIPNFTDEPGVDALPGDLIPGMAVGFDILGPVLSWSPNGFAQPSPERVAVRQGGSEVVSPTGDGVVPGFVFGQAGLDPSASFHHHVTFLLRPEAGGAGGAPEGVWLFTWALWTDAPGIERTEPLHVVFAQGAGVAALPEAVAWVEAHLAGPECVADFAPPFGTVDVFDLLVYLDAYAAGDPDADVAPPAGTVDVFDLIEFVSAYSSGCP